MGAGIAVGFAAVSAGIAEAGAAVGAGIAAIGVGAETAAAIGTGLVTGGLVGAGLGGVESLATGQPFLRGVGEGALGGAVTGGAIGGLGGTIGSALGSTTAGDIVAGGIGGVAGAELTGGNPLIGAAGGALSGGIASIGADGVDSANAPPGTASPGGNATGISAPGPGAAGTAAPPGIGVDPSVGDFTGGPSVVGGGDGAGGGGFGGANAGAGGTAIANADPGAPLVPGGPTAGSELSPIDVAALRSQQGLVGGGESQNALLLSDSTGGAAAPPGASPGGSEGQPDVGFLGRMGLSPENASNAMVNPDGSFVTPPIPPGGGVVDPTTGSIMSPGDAGYTAALDQLNAPQMAPQGSAAGRTDFGNFSSNPLGTVGSALSNNAGWLLPAGGLALAAGKDLLSSGPTSSGVSKTLEGQANTLNANAQQLESFLTSGQLPAGVANSIHSATQSAKASIRSQYASRGMSGSSAEAQDLAAVDQRASQQGGQIALQLLQTGISEAGLANQIYAQLLQHTTQQDAALSGAIGSFASSLVPRTTVNLQTTAG